MPTNDVSDGVITGTIVPTKKLCRHCKTDQVCIEIREITLDPPLETLTSLMIFFQLKGDGKGTIVPVTYIGIGCGCYAKGHRQLCHIAHSIELRGKIGPPQKL